jgi:uncharacterized damage-inducible protein DinB
MAAGFLKENHMLDILKYHARCNSVINNTMIDIIARSDKMPYQIMIEGYYKSINAILDHYFIADTIWLKAFKQIRDSEIFENDILKIERKWEDQQFDDIQKYKVERNKLDELIIQYMNELQNDDLNKTIVRMNRNGSKMEKILWKSIVHMFNHDTHHRGQISVILDKMNVENDYSNMIRID